MPLSDAAIRRVKATEKQQKPSDGGGLFLLVHPNGSPYWRWKYRVNGKEKLLGMGIYPEVSLAKAREAREDARRLLASGVDPSEHRKAATASRAVADGESFEVIAREWLAGRP
ncbi:Arm DNA-binding domain-containing protein [Stenotrophomonas rhizophila]